MRYMFSLFGEEGGWQDASPEDMKAEMDRWEAFGREAVEAGVMVGGDALQESETATTLRIQQQAEPIVSDGPFAETRSSSAATTSWTARTWTRRWRGRGRSR
jgi:hypothetical protein